MTIQANPKTQEQAPRRLLCVDALRGFDMFWILGGEGLFAALWSLTGWAPLKLLELQMQHSNWHGLTAYDLIFPLFIFLSGVSLGFSAKRIEHYPPSVRAEKYRHALKRLLLLLLLGIVYNHGWGSGAPMVAGDIRYASVLGRIGVAWFVSALLVWHSNERTQIIVALLLLLGYYLLLNVVSVAGFGGGQLDPAHVLNAWVDQHWLPGSRYHQLPVDPEGLLSNIPSIVNALLGVSVGRHIRRCWQRPRQLASHLLCAALLLLLLGYLWASFFPLNKSLWTSSFVLVSCGYSLLLLLVFYLLIDVLHWQRWAKFFAVIGVNSIAIYLLSSLMDWRYLVQSLFGGVMRALPAGFQALLSVLALLLLQWMLLLWLHQRKIYIKV